PKWVEERFDEIVEILQAINPEIWWKLKKRGSPSFFSPAKHFLTIHISRNGLNLTLFTRGKPMLGVEPIAQKDAGGKLWGRLKVGKNANMAAVTDTLLSCGAGPSHTTEHLWLGYL